MTLVEIPIPAHILPETHRRPLNIYPSAFELRCQALTIGVPAVVSTAKGLLAIAFRVVTLQEIQRIDIRLTSCRRLQGRLETQAIGWLVPGEIKPLRRIGLSFRATQRKPPMLLSRIDALSTCPCQCLTHCVCLVFVVGQHDEDNAPLAEGIFINV